MMLLLKKKRERELNLNKKINGLHSQNKGY